jgi:hypothetical protein
MKATPKDLGRKLAVWEIFGRMTLSMTEAIVIHWSSRDIGRAYVCAIRDGFWRLSSSGLSRNLLRRGKSDA